MSENALNLVLAAVGIVGGAMVSYYFFRIARKERQPVYALSGHIVVRGDEKRDIEVRYKGREVPLVSRTVVALWNAGREPIRRDDLVENHPLIVKLPKDAVFLDAQVLATTKPEIDFDCSLDEWHRVLNLDFSFLNHQDGGAIEFLHTSDDPRTVEIEGTVVGVDGPPRPFDTRWGRGWLWPSSRYLAGAALLLLLAVEFGVAIGTETWMVIALLGAFVASFTVLLLTDILDSRKMEPRGIPRVLREALGWIRSNSPATERGRRA